MRQPVRCKVRITAKDGLCTAALQVWGAVAFGAENRLRQWVHCRSFLVFRLPDWGFPLAPSRIALPGNRRVISSGGSLPTPPDFYCLMAVKSEQRIDNREEVFLSVSVGVSLIHDSLLSII